MKNKKGFTLIELLAVIVILVTISAIAIPSITASLERSKVKQRDAKIATIVEGARLYYTSHKARIRDDKCYISMTDLKLTEKELENPMGGTFSGVVVYMNDEFNYTDGASSFPKCVGD